MPWITNCQRCSVRLYRHTLTMANMKFWGDCNDVVSIHMPFYPFLQCLLCILTLSMPSSQSPMWQLFTYLAATLCHFTPFATLCHLSLCATLSMSPTSLCRTISPSSKDDPAPLTIAPWFLGNCLFVNSKDKHSLQFPAVLFILKYQATSTVYFNYQWPKNKQHTGT